jgi:hypothetical protein
MVRIKSILLSFFAQKTHKVRTIASVVGKLISLEAALGKAILIGTRLATIRIVIETEISESSKRRRNPWEKSIELETDTMSALRTVYESLDRWNGHPIRTLHTGIALSSILPAEATASLDRKIPARKLHDRRAIMASDASDFAVASYSVEGLPEFSFSSNLTNSEKKESSSCRELLAIQRTLEHMTSTRSLQQEEWTTLFWLTDNANVEKMLAKGSGILRITKLALDILKRGRELKLDIHPIWVSRENPYLLKADGLSKGIDTDNWEIERQDFENLNNLFGPFSIDLFATAANSKCEKFYTRAAERGAQGVDAFCQNWSGECAYAAPPVTFVMRTIRKAALVRMGGVLIVPLWRSARFWTYAFRDGRHLNAMFSSVQVVRMKTKAWEIATKNILNGKEQQFLAIQFASTASVGGLESQLGDGRCFRKLFKKPCDMC